MRVHIKRISPGSLSAILGFIHGIIGLLVGIVGFILSLFGSGSHPHHLYAITGTAWDGAAFIILYPLFYALFGVIAGFIISWIYNFAARFTKGILIELDEAGRYDD